MNLTLKNDPMQQGTLLNELLGSLLTGEVRKETYISKSQRKQTGQIAKKGSTSQEITAF